MFLEPRYGVARQAGLLAAGNRSVRCVVRQAEHVVGKSEGACMHACVFGSCLLIFSCHLVWMCAGLQEYGVTWFGNGEWVLGMEMERRWAVVVSFFA